MSYRYHPEISTTKVLKLAEGDSVTLAVPPEMSAREFVQIIHGRLHPFTKWWWRIRHVQPEVKAVVVTKLRLRKPGERTEKDGRPRMGKPPQEVK